MEKIQNEGLQLVYDEHCPLCNWYTAKFIRFHFLGKNGRIPWTVAHQDSALTFDRTLSRNKIALLKDGVAVEYGLDSLLEVLSLRFPLIGGVGRLPGFHHLLLFLYNFISYNRKVIVPNSCNDNCACIPDRNPLYRWVYIVFAGVVVNFATGTYFEEHLSEFYIARPIETEMVLYAAQFLFMYLIFCSSREKNFFEYAGNLATVSLIGALLLLFFHLLLVVSGRLGIRTDMLGPLCFGIVFFAMWHEHRRRLRVLGFSKKLSNSWLVYRVLIYPFAFIV